MRHVECPNCGADITHSYEHDDYSSGITWAGWYCADCDVFIEDDPQDDDYVETRRRDRD
jgi:hypothetical protein